MAFEGIRGAIEKVGVGSQVMRGQIPTAATGGRGGASNVLKAALAEGLMRPPSTPSGSAVNTGVNNALKPQTGGSPSQNTGGSGGTGNMDGGAPTKTDEAAPQTFAAAGNGPLDSIMKAMQAKMMQDTMKGAASEAAKQVREDQPVKDPQNSFDPRVVQELGKMYNEMNKGMLDGFKKLVEELKDPEGKFKEHLKQTYHKEVTAAADNFIKSIEDNLNPKGKKFHPKAVLDSYNTLMEKIEAAREESGDKGLYKDLEESATDIKDNYIVPMQMLAANNNGAVLHAEDALIKSIEGELKILATSETLKGPVAAFKEALAKPGNNNEAINESYGNLKEAYDKLPSEAKKELEADFKEVTQAKDLMVRANDIGSLDYTKFSSDDAYKAELAKQAEPFTQDFALHIRQNDPDLLEETFAKIKESTAEPSPMAKAEQLLDTDANFPTEEDELELPPVETPAVEV